ncbi:MAG: FHA domain-containing protein [Labilithrix sp.]
MPVTIIVRRDEQGESPSLTFDGARLLIGRSDGADVRLPDPSVSLRHATIRADAANYSIVDEGSTNGTSVGGVKLLPQTPRLLKTGDLVRVGRVWLEISIGQRAPTPDLALATRDLALAMVKKAMEAHGDDTRARIRVVEGPDLGTELTLAEDNRRYVLGRAERCDLPLADEDASREHAAVVRKNGQVFITDLQSSNGVRLGEQRLTPDRDTVWRAATMVRIGQSVLALEEPVGNMLADLAALPDEKLPAAEEPPPPSSIPSSLRPASAAPPATPPPAEPTAAAPIAEVPKTDSRSETTVVRRKSKRTWGTVDYAVVGVAIVIIGASLAGLVWVLR